MTTRRAIRGILIVAAALAVVSGCGRKDVEQTLGAVEIPDQEFADFTTTESDSGRVTWKLWAPRARVYNERNLLVTDEPRIEFYDEFGEVSSVLTAEKGEYNKVSHDLTALGDVVVTSREGYTLETETLVWVEKLGEIHTEDFVRFTKATDVLTGYGLRSDPDLDDVEILRDVKAFLRDEDGAVSREVDRETGETDE
ncbi:MAG: LPS export ABC transporter periplasmic protein LptC [Candidatus Krumholzibacteriota bacterium]|nr:LPS export ABC transporter periplasmic protein LptC [Candidatus Krumholzibacteriota bacterium]